VLARVRFYTKRRPDAGYRFLGFDPLHDSGSQGSTYKMSFFQGGSFLTQVFCPGVEPYEHFKAKFFGTWHLNKGLFSLSL
jgi:hypothetical protein